jgi:ribose transport system substrate-binding protein
MKGEARHWRAEHVMTKRMGTVLLLVIVALIAVGTVSAQDDPITIGYAVMGMDHPLFQAMMEGAQTAADQLGVELIMVDATWNVDTQNAQLEDFIAQQVDVVMVNPVTATETVPTLERVREAGIPIIAIDTRPVGFEPDAFVTMNHYQGGYIMGWQVANDLNCEGRWAAIWAIGNEQAASRMRGFETGLAENCQVRGLENNFEKEGEYSGITGPIREVSRQIAETLLVQYPAGELAFIFGQTDEFANGAYLATQAAGRSDVQIYGMDNNADMRQFISDGGNMVATTAHLAKEVGAAAVQSAINIVSGEPYLPEVQLNFQLITQDNIGFDPGWEGQYSPSFSAFFFPEQLGVLLPN